MVKPILVYSKSAFSEWLYTKVWPWFDGNTDIQDIDFVVFNYITGDIMTLESKERNGHLSSAQRDTHNILRQLLMFGAANSTIDTKRGLRPIHYRGHHVIVFQNTTPDDGWVRVDGTIVSRDEFIQFLNFGRRI